MHRILSQLHQDHKNLARVLHIMETGLTSLEKGTGEDLELMLNATDYIQHYPDLIHHPRENFVFDVLMQRTDEAADEVSRLKQEHETLPHETVRFREMLDSAISGQGIVSREDLVNKIKAFLKLEWDHMNLEERHLFPLIDRTLTDEDWEGIEKKIDESKDPLFSDTIEASYNKLYEYLKNK